MNLDRALSILGLIVGAVGAAAGVYVSQKDFSMGLLLASGWIAAALIGTTICTLAFRAITAMEKAHGVAITALESAYGAAITALEIARKDADNCAEVLRRDVIALQAEVGEFRNISRALSAVIAPDNKPKVQRPPRVKRPSIASARQGQTEAVQNKNGE